MSDSEGSTLQSIHQAAKKEFLEKGFKSASLRNIVKAAGVTTGAFYGYYDSKEELFDALVQEQYTVCMSVYKKAQKQFADLPEKDQPDNMSRISGDCMDWMVGYIYENKEVFRLLLCCADGTKYEHMIDEMVDVEIQATHDFIEVLGRLGQHAPQMDPQLEHILVTGMFSAFFEIAVHDMPQRKAEEYVKELRAFYTAGWMKIMGLQGL